MQQIGKNITWHKSLSASERASNEQIRPLSAEHGAQSDKDTLQTWNQGPGKQEARTNGPTKCDRGLNCARAPCNPTPPHCRPLVGPNFSHHKARVQAVGWSPLGTRKQGSRPFAAPPPQQKWGRKQAQHSPPPQYALAPPHPHCRPSHGDQGPSPHGQGADAERWVCWDLGPAW